MYEFIRIAHTDSESAATWPCVMADDADLVIEVETPISSLPTLYAKNLPKSVWASISLDVLAPWHPSA